MYICVCICTYVWCVFAEEARSQCWVSSSIASHLIFFYRASHWTWTPPIWLDWMASKSEGPSHVLLSRAGVPGIHHQFFTRMLGSEARSSCLNDKPFPDWAISPALYNYYYLNTSTYQTLSSLKVFASSFHFLAANFHLPCCAQLSIFTQENSLKHMYDSSRLEDSSMLKQTQNASGEQKCPHTTDKYKTQDPWFNPQHHKIS